MKVIRNGIALALSLVIGLTCFTACNKKLGTFSHKKTIKVAKEMNLDECSFGDFENALSSGDKSFEGYLNVTDEDATAGYNVLINRTKTWDSYKLQELTALSVGTDGQTYVYLMTFRQDTRAEKFFNEYVAGDVIEEEDDYKYAFSTDSTYEGKELVKAAYLSEENVLIIRSFSNSTDVLEELCENFDLVSPVK